jgi:HEAT repeat protein
MMKIHLTLILLLLLSCAAHAQLELTSESDLIAILQSNAGQAEKAKACHDLSIVGGNEAIATLSSLLSNEILGDYARMALEAMDSTEADAVFREKLTELEGSQLIGVINSIGVRRDRKAVPALASLVKQDAHDVSSAAIAALGFIASDRAIEILLKTLKSADKSLHFYAADACLAAADVCVSQQKNRKALSLYDAICGADTHPAQCQAAAYHSLVLKGSSGLPLLIERLRGNDLDEINVALRAARALSSPAVVQALGKELEHVAPRVQEGLISVLADSGVSGVVTYIQPLAASKVQGVREAALIALGQTGDESTVPVLVKAAEAGGRDADIALDSLKRLQGDGIDLLILDAMKTSWDPLRSELVGVLAQRHATVATPYLLKEVANHANSSVRAAIDALGTLSTQNDLPALLDILTVIEDDTTRHLTETAIARTSMRASDPAQGTEKVLLRLRSSTLPTLRISLSRVLGSMGGKKAFEAVHDMRNDADLAVKENAVRVLASWPDAYAAETLLDLAQTGDTQTHRILALRGYLRLLAQGEVEDPAEKVLKYTQVLSFANDSDTKRLVLAGLAKMGHDDALKLAMSLFADPSVQSESAFAAARIARQVKDHNPTAARAAMEHILSVETSENLIEEVRAVLEAMP